MVSAEGLKVFNHVLVPVTTLQREVKMTTRGGTLVEIDVFERVIKISPEKVKCNPVLSFFNLLRFDKNKDKFTPREIRLDDHIEFIEL